MEHSDPVRGVAPILRLAMLCVVIMERCARALARAINVYSGVAGDVNCMRLAESDLISADIG